MRVSSQKEASRVSGLAVPKEKGNYAVLGVVALLLIIAFVRGLGIETSVFGRFCPPSRRSPWPS